MSDSKLVGIIDEPYKAQEMIILISMYMLTFLKSFIEKLARLLQ